MFPPVCLASQRSLETCFVFDNSDGSARCTVWAHDKQYIYIHLYAVNLRTVNDRSASRCYAQCVCLEAFIHMLAVGDGRLLY